MTDCVRKYKCDLKKELHCGHGARKRLLDDFSGRLANYLEEHPAPDRQTLDAAFGKPEDFAKELMENTTEKEREAYKRDQCIAKWCRRGLIAVFILLTVYVYLIKQRPIRYENKVVVTDERPSPTKMIDN